MAAASMKDWLADNRMIPSWVLSALLHAALVALVMWLIPYYQTRQPVGDGTEPAREIGIVVKERGVLIEPSDGNDSDSPIVGPGDSTPLPRDELSPQTAVPDTPAIKSVLPKTESLPGIGPGAASSVGLPDPKSMIKSQGIGAGTGATGGNSGGMPGTSFMGVKDKGTRVVYVVDASGSMYHHNAIDQAKGALVASLNALDAQQQFQIIFYSETPRLMALKSTPKKSMYFATDLNKTNAQQFIQGVQPDAGTEHLSAIKLGLSFTPEVMYVLTDSGDPKLTPRELDEIAKRNGGRTRIHCIEFGVGKELNGDTSNFLKKLAQQNDGTHRYVNIMDAARKR